MKPWHLLVGLFVFAVIALGLKDISDSSHEDTECRIARQYNNEGMLTKYNDPEIVHLRSIAESCGIYQLVDNSPIKAMPIAEPTFSPNCKAEEEAYALTLGDNAKVHDVEVRYLACRQQYPASAQEADAAVDTAVDIWNGLIDELHPYSESCIMEKLAYVQHPEDPSTRRTAAECHDYWQGQAIGKYFESQ